MPSYKTVARIIDALLEELAPLFRQVLNLRWQCGLVGGERGYIDGTKVKANASKHKAMSYGCLIKKLGSGKENLEALFAAFRDVLDGLECYSAFYCIPESTFSQQDKESPCIKQKNNDGEPFVCNIRRLHFFVDNFLAIC